MGNIYKEGERAAFHSLFESTVKQGELTREAIKNNQYWFVISGKKEFTEPMAALKIISPVAFEAINAFKQALRIYGPFEIGEHLSKVPRLDKYKTAPQKKAAGIIFHANFLSERLTYTLEFEIIATGKQNIIAITQMKSHETIRYTEKPSNLEDKKRILTCAAAQREMKNFNKRLYEIFKKELENHKKDPEKVHRPVLSEKVSSYVFSHEGKEYSVRAVSVEEELRIKPC